MITYDPTINLGTIITGAPMLIAVIWGAAVVHTRVGHIETKLDEFITRAEVAALKESADKEHAAIRREINGLRAS